MSTLLETAPVSGALAAPTIDEAIAFIWAEADMLDRLDYKPWLKLWTETGRYIIPTERNPASYDDVLNIVNDDAEMRSARAKRLLSGFSMSSAPPARTVRTVSRFVPVSSEGDLLTLRAAQILVEYKYQHQRTLAADMVFGVRRAAEGLRLEQKIVTLVNCDDYQHGIGYLL